MYLTYFYKKYLQNLKCNVKRAGGWGEVGGGGVFP